MGSAFSVGWLTLKWRSRPTKDYGSARSYSRCFAYLVGAQVTHFPDHVRDCVGDRVDCADGGGGRGPAQGAGRAGAELGQGHYDCVSWAHQPAGWGTARRAGGAVGG